MEVELKPRARLLWGSLALLVFVGAWLLTRLITHVDHRQQATVSVAVDEQPPFRLGDGRLTPLVIQHALPRIPSIVVIDGGSVAIVITPALRSVTIEGITPSDLNCVSLDRALENGPVSALLAQSRLGPLSPLPVSALGSRALIVVPDELRHSLASLPDGRGLIRCKTSRTLAASPTFSERAMTVRASNGLLGSVILDISALEDITNLRFSGGVEVPFAGERTRLLTGDQNVVAVDWVDASAQEERDIILVIIGALAAIGAAMAIEAIRPFIER